MATVYAQSTANWSLAIWLNDATGLAYGSAPLAGDTVLANGKTITIDQTVSVTSLSTAAGAIAAAGGSFACSSSRTIQCSGNIVAGTTTCLSLSGTGNIVVVAAQILGSTTKTNSPGLTIVSGAVNVAATADAVGGAVNSFGCNHLGTGTLTLTGNAIGSSIAASHGVVNSSATGTIAVTGNATAGSFTGAVGAYNNSSGIITVGGTSTAGSGSGSYGVRNSTGTCTLNNVIGGSANGAVGVFNNSTGIVTINGTLTGGSAAGAFGAVNNSTGQILCNGSVVASSTCPAINDVVTSAGFIAINNGPIVNSTGINAVFASHVCIGAAVQWTIAKPGTPPAYNGSVTLGVGGSPTLAGEGYLGDFAPSTQVRFSINSSDASGNMVTLTGTPAVMVYKSGSTAESAAGVSVTADYDSRTGLTHVVVDMTADTNFFASGFDYRAVMTAGTIGTLPVANRQVAHWSVDCRERSGYSLTSAYDPAKNAAAAGAKMDLVDAPNGTALTAIGTAVWNSATRTLSSFGTLVNDTVTAVWTAGTRTLTTNTGTVDSLSDAALLQIRTTLNGVVLTVGGPVWNDGSKLRMELTAGDDYSAADSRAIQMDLDGTVLPDLTGATVQLRLSSGQSRLLINGTIVVSTGSVRTVRFEPAASDTVLLPTTVNGLFAVLIHANGRTITPADGRGTLVVAPRVAP